MRRYCLGTESAGLLDLGGIRTAQLAQYGYPLIFCLYASLESNNSINSINSARSTKGLDGRRG